jgi:C4-dicarboxylate-specific signal transduction histidine kinase
METGLAITGKIEEKLLLDGRTGWALVAKIPLRNAAGEIFGTCGISKDITALKNSEEALQAANARLAAQAGDLENALREVNVAHDQLHAAHEELKTAQRRMVELENVRWIARLAFGVAHEVRNPLGTLEMGLNFLKGRAALAEAPGVAETLAYMSEAVQRADVVISALMDGAVSSGVAVEPTAVAATVEDALEMMKSRRFGRE